MPNHVRNVLKFKHLKPKDIEFIITTIAEKQDRPVGDFFDAKTFHDYIIDFNKIIPEPKTKKECPEDCLVNKDSHIMEEEDRPWFDWYTWHNKYWGTKWNAYDGYTKVGKSYVIFVFSTAWSSPFLVIEQLRLLGYPFELRYADEDIGNNCGILDYSETCERRIYTL